MRWRGLSSAPPAVSPRLPEQICGFLQKRVPRSCIYRGVACIILYQRRGLSIGVALSSAELQKRPRRPRPCDEPKRRGGRSLCQKGVFVGAGVLWLCGLETALCAYAPQPVRKAARAVRPSGRGMLSQLGKDNRQDQDLNLSVLKTDARFAAWILGAASALGIRILRGGISVE